MKPTNLERLSQQLIHRTVAAVPEESSGVSNLHHSSALPIASISDSRVRAWGLASPETLDLAERLLDRVEITASKVAGTPAHSPCSL